jgi:hypothetical protein
MSTIFPDRLRIGELMYNIDTHPLEPFLDALPARPEKRSTINTLYGYVATWEYFDGKLYLVDISSQAHLRLFENASDPIVASWFSGLVRACRGNTRLTGNPPCIVWDEEVFLEVAQGQIVRDWTLDLRDALGQTSA